MDEASEFDPQPAAANIDDSIEKSLADSLDTGDRLVAACDAMVRESLGLFEKCRVALSEKRLFVLKGGRGESGWHVSFPRERCFVVKRKKRFDGSQLVIVQHGSGVTGLYFSRSNRMRAEPILSVMPHAEEATVVETEPTA
jgi:hypothetical protein